ncbi:MAG: phosphatase PAP2 family protein [Thermoleophilia bacterium]|nr:phosphatase PAP2 family protein [Thermoleophilia bacterium]
MTAIAHRAAVLPAVAAAPSPLSEVATFDIPAELVSQLTASERLGAESAAEFLKTHGRSERAMVAAWAVMKLGYPPKDDAPDLAVLHAIEAARTDDGIAAAKFWAGAGMEEFWRESLKDYTSKVGPAQARAAVKLLDDALMVTNQAAQLSKASVARTRPFVVDPTLTVAINKPGNNPSYPSGHTTAAYAGAEVMAYLMPDRAAEFRGLAEQVAYSRLYGGVHFPTDVVAGAKMATTVTQVLTKTSGVKPRRGTKKKAGNGGVAAGRHVPAPVLPKAGSGSSMLAATASATGAATGAVLLGSALVGAVHLAGMPLQGAVQVSGAA